MNAYSHWMMKTRKCLRETTPNVIYKQVTSQHQVPPATDVGALSCFDPCSMDCWKVVPLEENL